MRSQFDGLRSILGNSTVPVVDAPAVEQPAVANTPVDTSADLPDFSDLDRGLYKGDSNPAQPDAAIAFNALAAQCREPRSAEIRRKGIITPCGSRRS